MTEIIKSAIVPYSALDMRALVNDVPSYPEFLKWCEHGYILNAFSSGYEAGMQINLKGIRVDFSTVNTLTENGQQFDVTMALLTGPFKNLQGLWRFTQLSQKGSKVELQLMYEIRSQLIGRLFARGFEQVATQLVSDFVRRAGDVYA